MKNQKKTSIVVPLILLATFFSQLLALVPPSSVPNAPGGSIAQSAYPNARVPHAVIVVTSDADWAALAASGSGTAGDPWIIEDLEIDCAGAGVGINISGTTDYAVFRNVFVNDSGVGLTDGGAILQVVDNVAFTNCTFEYDQAAVGFVSTENCNVTNSTLRHSYGGVNLFCDDVDNAMFSDLVIENGTVSFMRLFTVEDSTNVTISESYLQNASQTQYVDNLNVDNVEIGGLLTMVNIENVTIIESLFTGDAGILLNTAVNVTVDGCTFNLTTVGRAVSGAVGVVNDLTVENSMACNVTDFVYAINDMNIKVDNNTIINASYIMQTSTNENVTITNNTITNTIYGVLMTANTGVVAITNNTIINATEYGIHVQGTDVDIVNNTIYSAGRGVYIDGFSDDSTIVGNDIRHMMINDAINVDNSDRVYIALNYVYAPGNVTNGETATGITLANTEDIIVENNTCEGINGTVDGYGVVVTGLCDNITVRYNNITDCWFGIASFDAATIEYNWFRNNYNDFEEDVLGSCDFEYNYYYEYFDVYPYDITINVTTTELENEYLAFHARSHFLDPPLFRNDTHPMYWAPWYPRDQVVNIRAFSNVNGQGIAFENLKIYVDSVQIATASPTIEHVLFRVTVSDFKGRLLHDSVYNLNATGSQLNIGVDIAVQLFFRFYSSIDFFGLDFTIVKLFIDGVRITRFDPIMELKIINVTITDFANVTIYSAILNLSVTGVFLDIPLPVAPITVQNLHDSPVIFNITRNGVTTGIAIGSGMGITMRFAIGNYVYRVYDTLGHMYVEHNVSFVGTDIVQLGPFPDIPAIPSTDAFRITSDAELAAFPGITGSGAFDDPYVIENYFINANLTYTYSFGIDIQNTRLYVLFKGIIIQGARDVGVGSANLVVVNATHVHFYNCTFLDIGDCESMIRVENSVNIAFDNCTLDGTGYSVLLRSFDVSDTNLFRLNSTTVIEAFIGLEISNVTNGNFTWNTFSGVRRGIMTQTTRLCHNWTVTNSTFSGASGILAESGFSIINSANWTISNNIISGFDVEGILMSNSNGSLIVNNTIHDVVQGIALFVNEGTIVEYNTIHHCRGGIATYYHANIVRYNVMEDCYSGIAISGLNFFVYTYHVLRSNTINRCDVGIDVGNSDDVMVLNMTISYSRGYAILVRIDALNFTCVGSYFKGNAAILQNETAINVFEYNNYYEYFDVHPYDMFLNFTTTELQGNQNVATGVIDLHPMYHSLWYNKEKTIHVRFFSNYDGFGRSFDNLRLYIDGEWIATEDPAVTDLVFRITIRDFLNNTIRDFLYNYNITTNIFLGFNMGEVEFRNDGNITSVVFLRSTVTTISFKVNPGNSRILNMIDGIYTLWVEDTEGDVRISAKSVTVNNGGYFNITIGSVIVVVPPINPIFQSLTLADVVQIIVVAAIVVAIVVFLAFFMRRITSGKGFSLGSKPRHRARPKSWYIH